MLAHFWKLKFPRLLEMMFKDSILFPVSFHWATPKLLGYSGHEAVWCWRTSSWRGRVQGRGYSSARLNIHPFHPKFRYTQRDDERCMYIWLHIYIYTYTHTHTHIYSCTYKDLHIIAYIMCTACLSMSWPLLVADLIYWLYPHCLWEKTYDIARMTWPARPVKVSWPWPSPQPGTMDLLVMAAWRVRWNVSGFGSPQNRAV